MASLSTLRTIADDLDRVIKEVACPRISISVTEDNYRGGTFVDIVLDLPGNRRTSRVQVEDYLSKYQEIPYPILVVRNYLEYCKRAFDLAFDRIPLHLNDTRYESNILEARLKGLV